MWGLQACPPISTMILQYVKEPETSPRFLLPSPTCLYFTKCGCNFFFLMLCQKTILSWLKCSTTLWKHIIYITWLMLYVHFGVWVHWNWTHISLCVEYTVNNLLDLWQLWILLCSHSATKLYQWVLSWNDYQLLCLLLDWKTAAVYFLQESWAVRLPPPRKSLLV